MTDTATPTAPQPTEHTAERLKELAGDEYKEPGNDAVDPSGPLNVDSAYERLQDLKDEKADAEAGLQKSLPQHDQEVPENDEPPSRAVWSTEDVQTITKLKQEVAQYQHDLAAFNEIKNIGIDTLAQGDTARAAMLRRQIRDAEKELAARQEALTFAAKNIQGKASETSKKQAEKALKTENAKLAQHIPDFNGRAVVTYLQGMGFGRQEINGISDHRLVVLADKARRYDEMTKGKKTDKVPKLRPGAKPQSFQKQASVSSAITKLKQTGRLDDALAVLTAKRSARA